jgi:DNA polymerase-3 subunit delta
VVQIKPADADRFLARPDPAIRVILIYGNDDGLVAERAERFAASVLGKDGDAFGRVRLDSAAIADDPGRLADEANAVPLFGGRRVITVNLSGNRSIQPSVEAVLTAPPVDSWVVIAAGDQRKGSGLRKLCESHPAAAAVACYADSDRDLDRLIDEETRAAGLTIAADARAALKGMIGADRMASRSEVSKLCLYAADAGTITIDDVRAIIGDVAASATDEVVDAAALGDAAALDRSYRRLSTAGISGSVVLGAAQRHFNFLQKGRAALDAGATADAIVARASPPVFFQRRTAIMRQLSGWSAPAIDAALARLDQALLDSRIHGAIADDVVAQALQSVAYMAAGGNRRAG